MPIREGRVVHELTVHLGLDGFEQLLSGGCAQVRRGEKVRPKGRNVVDSVDAFLSQECVS